MKSKQTIYFDNTIKSPAGVAQYLRKLVDKIESKTITFENEAPLKIQLAEVLAMDVELKEKNWKSKLNGLNSSQPVLQKGPYSQINENRGFCYEIFKRY